MKHLSTPVITYTYIQNDSLVGFWESASLAAREPRQNREKISNGGAGLIIHWVITSIRFGFAVGSTHGFGLPGPNT